MNGLDSFDPHWIWIAIGLALAALELLVPGVYLIWLAAAALVTGALTYFLGLGVAAQVIDFVFLALIFAFSARRFLRDKPIVGADPLLNKRGGRMVGETAVVTQAFDGGSGRVRHGDSEWLARGPDIAAGARVRIIGSDGSILLVEPLTLLAGEGTAPPKEV
ncbi:NfeD family protein [Pelagerythrobacter rhizovicinus]|uniref:NfeD family protein n=1 Tax=Pelagerythrobacter rhizovicinus TaxID=2268576 RepID=A0A4Q2KPL9_9SPHN|nr:NfeD family protein [Pelagerythrobacter rhizovicinus]RXZ65201.1 NfeD family protein [Pelagerythrobacter rhizovicinus]